MSDLQERQRSLFLRAIEFDSPKEVSQFLDEACGDDDSLRKHVETLLAANVDHGDLFDQPETGDPPADRTYSKLVGTSIGPYKLREKIGEGGFGVVFVAEQKQPVQRKVALKLIKPGMDSKDIIARFEAERQALAMMDHPNVAKVLDAGSTEDGRPYFVMELVHGESITKFCDQQKLTNRERLELFIDVCSAVQHAHQKGIIHRDLKPSNVMVTTSGDRMIPKVIDFGVAKAMHHQLTDKSIYTAYGQLVGTPMYMSPEQAELSSLDVDTRSDIYSLGVLLYELLTGATPFDKETFKQAGFDEIRRIIREDEPRRPSDRVSTLHADLQSTVSEKRNVDQRLLSRSLRGELDWIVLKAMEKDRARRYETANGLAADVKRYLDDEPVLACPPSPFYKFHKFTKRNKVSLAFAFLASLFLFAVTMGLLVSNHLLAEREQETKTALRTADINLSRAQRNLRLATENEKKATLRLAQLVKGNEILTSIFADLNLHSDQRNAEPIGQIMANRLITAGEQLNELSGGDPLIVAKMQLKLTAALASLGFAEAGLDIAEKSWATRVQHLGPNNRDTLESSFHLGTALFYAGELKDAVDQLKEAMQRCSTHLGTKDDMTLNCMNSLASAYNEMGKYDEEINLLEEAITIPQSPDDFEVPPSPLVIGAMMHNLGLRYAYVASEPEKGRKVLEDAVEFTKSHLGPEHVATLNCMSSLVGILEETAKNRSDLEGVLTCYEEILVLQRDKLGNDHPDTLLTLNNYGRLLGHLGQHDKAILVLKEASDRKRIRLGINDPETLKSMANLAYAYRSAGRMKESLTILADAYDSTVKNGFCEKTPHFDPLWIGELLLKCYSNLGMDVEAETLAGELTQKFHSLPPDTPIRCERLMLVAYVYMEQAMYEEAEPLLRECLDMRRRAQPGAWHVFVNESALGESLLWQAKFAESETMLLSACRGLEDLAASLSQPTKVTNELENSQDRIVTLYSQWNEAEPDAGYDAKAEEWNAKLQHLKDQTPSNKANQQSTRNPQKTDC